MAQAPKPYTRLTKNRSQIGRYTSLWLGSDHLMMVTSTGYTEDYARLMLRDVKGFFVTATDRRLWWRVVWAVCTTIFLIVVVAAVTSNGTPYVSGFFLVFCAVVLIWNEALGPTCRVLVVTGVQTAPIPSLVRRRKAQRVLERLRPLIDAAQADLIPPVPTAPPPATAAPVAEPPPAPPT